MAKKRKEEVRTEGRKAKKKQHRSLVPLERGGRMKEKR